MQLSVVSCSLKPGSRSRVMAGALAASFVTAGVPCHAIDLAEVALPMCDAGPCYSDPEVKRVTALLAASDGIVIATPIYNYNASAAAKNLIELTGSAWENKVAGFLCAAGGHSSYMAILSLANSLMLDYRTYIVPRFVYATGADFAGGGLSNPDVARRVEALAAEMVRVCAALRG
jgi:NAD(P)H-dependent FMN reductase